jgi:co-chaperonin GroES (HSP10)
MSTTPAFRPFGSRYLVLPVELKGKTIQIEDAPLIETQSDPLQKAVEGTVIAAGRDCKEAVEGTRVLFGQYSGYPQTLDGVEYLILAESELLGEKLLTPFDSEPCLPLGMGTIVS